MVTIVLALGKMIIKYNTNLLGCILSFFTEMSIYAFRSTSPTHAKCSICEEYVNNPKQLPCNHKLCQKCINHQISRLSILLNAQEHVSIVCPYCRDFFVSAMSQPSRDRRDLRRSKSVQSAPRQRTISKGHVTGYSGDRKAQRCQPCAEGAHYEVASFWCQNCSEFFCSTCAKYHRSMKLSKQHIVKTIRDKDRYDDVAARIYDQTRPFSARERKWDMPATIATRDGTNAFCEPCKQSKKSKNAKFVCETCSERLCDDCSKCHRTMKMSKAHKLIPLKDVMSKKEMKGSLDIHCAKHYTESLSLFCKRCQKSCCSICAMTEHSNCGKAATDDKWDRPETSVAMEYGNTQKNYYAWDKPSFHTKEKSISFEIKPSIKAKESKLAVAKYTIPKNQMEVRKGRLAVETTNEKDWIISMALLSNGDILLLQLYETMLKQMDSMGNLVSTCSFYGQPWSVAVYNDALAVVSFSDRKHLQLVNVSKSGLVVGKKLSTRHKCLAVCFARDLIAATCWEGCVHLINIAGQEVSIIDRDNTGQRMFTSPEYIAADKLGTSLYVSDFKRNSVTALKLLPNKIDNKPAFVFTDRDLQGPKGVAVDQDGVLYISGMTSRNIYRISPTGQLVQVYRRRADTDYYEDIAVSSAGDKLLVSAYEDNTIIVLRLKK